MDWEVIYRKHSPGVFQYLLHLSNSRPDAEDLLQETFVRAMNSAAALRQPEKVHSWLLAIARNLFLDARRQNPRWGGEDLDHLEATGKLIASEADDADRALLKEDFASALQAELADLPESYQTAFTLGIMQRLTYREIAEITGWSLSAVKINIFRARQRIAAAMGDFL